MLVFGLDSNFGGSTLVITHAGLMFKLFGLIWSISLIRHIYLSDIWQGLYSTSVTKKTCVTVRLDYVLKT